MNDRNMTSRPIDTISDRVYRLVRESLRSGTFAPGEKITHRKIATDLSVSVTPVREAIMRLVSEGNLSMKGPKTIVALELSRSEFEEISEIRIRLEGWAAELAAQNSTGAMIRDLSKLHDDYCNAREGQDGKSILEANSKFHFGLYEHSISPRLVQIIDGLWVSCGPMIGLLRRSLKEDGDGQRFHERALNALEKGDATGVRQAIVDDISTGRNKILGLFDNVCSHKGSERSLASSA